MSDVKLSTQEGKGSQRSSSSISSSNFFRGGGFQVHVDRSAMTTVVVPTGTQHQPQAAVNEWLLKRAW
jgi:hypothetical protein